MINIRYLKVFMRNNNLDLGRQSTTDLSAFSITNYAFPILFCYISRCNEKRTKWTKRLANILKMFRLGQQSNSYYWDRRQARWPLNHGPIFFS